MAQAPATVLQEVNALYIAMYGRAADSIGLNYWVGQISAQFPGTTGATPLPEPGQPGNAQAVAIENFLGLAFFNAAPAYFAGLYPNTGGGAITDIQFIQDLYQNIGGNAGDAGGINYWFTQLQGLETTTSQQNARAELAGQFAAGVLGFDFTPGAAALGLSAADYAAGLARQAEFQNKVSISQFYADESASSTAAGTLLNATSTSSPAFAAEQHLVLTVTNDPNTVSAAQAAILAAVSGNSLAPINALLVASFSITDNAGGGAPVANQTTGGGVNEGGTVTYTIHDPGAADGTVLNYTTSGSGNPQVTSAHVGTLTVMGGEATVLLTTDAHVFNSPDTSIVLTVSGAGTPVATDTVILHEVGMQNVTDGLAGSSTNLVTHATTGGQINQGQPIVFTVTTTGVSGLAVQGLMEAYTITGSANGQVVGSLTGTVTLDSTGHASVSIGTLANVFGSSPSTGTIQFNLLNSASATIATDAVTVNEGTITIANNSPISEGSTATFTITTANLPNGTVETYTLTGGGTSQVNPVLQAGTVTIVNNTATLNIPTIANLFNQGAGTQPLILTLGGPSGGTSTETINENATISVTAPASETGANSVIEGNPVTFTLAASANVPAGTVVSYTLSGNALGNVPLAQQTGTATVSPGGNVTITINTLANDLNNLPTDPANHIKQLTLTLNSLNNSVATPTIATANINENSTGIFNLTTGTDTGGAFTGNAAGSNVFNSGNVTSTGGFNNVITLGSGDILTGQGPANVLNIATSGPVGVLLTGWTSSGIQTFNVGANILAAAGTLLDMSFATGVTNLNDVNSAGSLGLLNVQAPLVLKLTDPSDLGVPVNLGVQYIGSAAAAVVAAGGQVLNLDPTVSPVTGLAHSSVDVNVPVFIIHSDFNASATGINGLVSLNGGLGATLGGNFAYALLTSVTMLGNASFVAGTSGSGMAAFAFTGAGTDTLNLTGFNGVFYNIGDPTGGFPGITDNTGALTITGGSHAFTDLYNPAIAPGNGGVQQGGLNSPTITALGNVTINVNNGSFQGQKVNAGSINIVGTNGGFTGVGGFVSDPAGNFAKLIANGGGSVTIDGIAGGLGGGNVAKPNGVTAVTTGAVITTTGSGAVNIGQTANVTGNINETINTVNGLINVNLTSGTNTVLFNTSDASADTIATTVNIAGGTNVLDFTQGNGFRGSFFNVPTSTFIYDMVNGNGGTNTLILQAGVMGAGGPLGGLATGVQTIDFFAGNMTTAGNIQTQLLDQNGAAITFNVDVAGLTTLEQMANNDIVNLLANSDATSTVTFGVNQFTANATETLNVQGGDFITFSNALDYTGPGPFANYIGTLNFGAGAAGTTNLTLTNVLSLNTLTMTGTSVTIGTASSGGGALSTITGNGNSNYDLRGLTGVAVTGNYGGGLGGDNGNVNMNMLAAAGGTINLAVGIGTTGVDNVAVGGGSWTITTADSTVVVNPGLGNNDIITTGPAADAVYVGSVNYASSLGVGTVNINTGGGNDNIYFDDTVVGFQPNWAADTINGGTGTNHIRFQANGSTPDGGPMVITDAGFAHISNIQEIDLAPGSVAHAASNSLTLGANAAADASGAGGLLIVTGGGGNAASSTVISATAAFTQPVNVLIGSVFGNGGDAGGDNITTAAAGGSNPLTVTATDGDFNTSFAGALNTIQGPAEGIFASTIAPANNTLVLTADSNIADILSGASGLNGVQTIMGSQTQTFPFSGGVFLAGPNAALTTINLANPGGGDSFAGIALVWAQNDTTRGLTIKAGYLNEYFSDVVVVGAKHTGNAITVSGGSNWIYSPLVAGGSGATETGADGAPNGLVFPSPNLHDFTTFVFNNVFAESPFTVIGATPASPDTYITNFNPTYDQIALNPFYLLGGAVNYVGPAAGAANFLTAEALLTVAPATAQAVYEIDTQTLWISNDGELDSTSAEIHLVGGGTINFSNASFTTNPNVATNGNTSGFSYVGGNIVFGLPTDTTYGPLHTLQLTIPVFNAAAPNQQNLPGVSLVNPAFVGQGGTITLNKAFTNYNFSALTSGVTVITPAYISSNPADKMGPGTLTGTIYNDSFFVNSADLFNGFIVNGGGGLDQITIDPVGPLVITLSGVTFNATTGEVQQVQTLNLVDSAGSTISFLDSLTGIQNITEQPGSGPATINTNHMVNGGILTLNQHNGNIVNVTGTTQLGTTIAFGDKTNNLVDVAAGLGVPNITGNVLAANTLKLEGTSYDISGAIETGVTILDMNNAAVSTLTLRPDEYNQIGSFILANTADHFIFTADGAMTATAADLTGLFVLAADGTNTNLFTLSSPGQNVSGGSDSDTVNIANVNITGTIALAGGANVIEVTGPAVDMHAATITATGGTMSLLINAGTASNTTMSNAEYNLFNATGISLGGGDTPANTTITFSDTDGANVYTFLNANVGHFTLASGSNSYIVGSNTQSVDAHLSAGPDQIALINPTVNTYTGTLAFGTGADQLYLGIFGGGVAGTFDIHSATITTNGGTVQLNLDDSLGDTLTLTTAQENLFHSGGAVIEFGSPPNTYNIFDNASTVLLTANEAVIGTVNIDHNTTTVNVSVGSTFSGAGWDANTLGLASSTADVIQINNGILQVALSDVSHYVNITGFTTGTAGTPPADTLAVTFSGVGHVTTSTLIVTAGAATAGTVMDISSALFTYGSAATSMTLANMDGLIHINAGLTTTAATFYEVALTTTSGAAIYEFHTGAAAVDAVQLIGVVANVATSDALLHNFA
jgi:hypothetical protein